MVRPNFALDADGRFGEFLLDPKRKIPLAHLENTCKPGKGQATCRYICQGPKGMVCAKHTPMRPHLDKYAAGGTLTARGDNCTGMGQDESATSQDPTDGEKENK